MEKIKSSDLDKVKRLREEILQDYIVPKRRTFVEKSVIEKYTNSMFISYVFSLFGSILTSASVGSIIVSKSGSYPIERIIILIIGISFLVIGILSYYYSTIIKNREIEKKKIKISDYILLMKNT